MSDWTVVGTVKDVNGQDVEGFKDYMSCGACGNTGFIKRDGEEQP